MERDEEATIWSVYAAIEKASGLHFDRGHMWDFMWSLAEETSDVVTEAINPLLYQLTHTSVEDAIHEQK